MAKKSSKYRQVHLSHCNQGEYKGTCKYGNATCPALKPPALKDIAAIIQEAFYPPPEERAARKLFSLGVRERDLFGINKFLPDPLAISVSNALRDLERQGKVVHL